MSIIEMRKGDKGKGIWSTIAVLLVVSSILLGAVSVENVSADLTKNATNAEIQALVANASSTEFTNQNTLLGVAKSNTIIKPPVVSRTTWGCPDGQGSPRRPPVNNNPITHIIIHHTTTPNELPWGKAGNWSDVVYRIWAQHTYQPG